MDLFLFTARLCGKFQMELNSFTVILFDVLPPTIALVPLIIIFVIMGIQILMIDPNLNLQFPQDGIHFQLLSMFRLTNFRSWGVRNLLLAYAQLGRNGNP